MLDNERLSMSLSAVQYDHKIWFRTVEYFPSVDSTQTELMRRLKNYNIDDVLGSIIVTQHQTQGRGRLNRTWVSHSQEILAMSGAIALDTFTVPTLIPLTVGLAMYRTLCHYELSPVLKWPNDILVAHALSCNNEEKLGKISGILVEVATHMCSGKNMAIIGVGVNYDLSSQTKNLVTQGAYPPVGLSEVLRDNPRENPDFLYNFFTHFITTLSYELTRLEKNPSAIVQQYSRECMTVGADVFIHCDPQSELGIFAHANSLDYIPGTSSQDVPSVTVVPAHVIAIGSNGELLVRVSDRNFTITTGDIIHVRHASPERT